jgi:hypothetical protein
MMDWVRVAVIESKFEADLVEGVCAGRGLACRIREHRDGAYDGLYLLQQGWGSLWTEQGQAARAAAVVAEVRRAYTLKVVKA